MNFRKSAVLVSFVALAPLSAYADAPSGDYWDVFVNNAPATEVADTRSENSSYVEFTIDQLVAESSRGSTKSRDEVRAELAAMPLPSVEA